MITPTVTVNVANENFASAARGERAILLLMPSPELPPDYDESAHAADTASELQSLGVNISKDLQALLERGLHSTRLPRPLKTAKAAAAMQQAFEIIGGVPRLALWADRNPDKFYPLFARMIPQTIAPVVPEDPNGKNQEAQWPEWLSARRLAYQESAQVAEDVKVKEPRALPVPLPKRADSNDDSTESP